MESSREIIEHQFKDEFGDDWSNELRDFEYTFGDYYNCSVRAVKKSLQICDDIKQRELLIAFHQWKKVGAKLIKKFDSSNETIDFAVHLTGHDKETIEQMYDDWRRFK